MNMKLYEEGILSMKTQKRTKIEIVLYISVILTIIRQFFLGSYANMFLGILTLLLFSLPKVIEKRLGVNIPTGLETVILIFIYSAEILGEINEIGRAHV